ncbi:MAG TPA: LptF/LptG family permease [Acidobacteriota bacterium]|nr:LptF/LptG family permease [Acidobacteriota bacterium]
MRKIDKLLYLAITPPFFVSLIVLTFVVTMHQFGALSELLVTQNVSLGGIFNIIFTILPAVLIFSLPLSYLIGILIGITGLSGESQLLALRVGGFPLSSFLRFIIAFGVIVGIVTAALSLFILPHTNDRKRNIVDDISLGVATSKIQARVFNEDFPGYVFYIDEVSADRHEWKGVFVYDNSDPQSPRTIIARYAKWVKDEDNRRLQLHLQQGASYAVSMDDPVKDNVSLFASTDISIQIKDDSERAIELKNRQRRVTETSSVQLWKSRTDADSDNKVRQLVELNRRIALPFSIFPFALLGLALAVSVPKSGKTLGFGMSLVAVIIFYMMFLNGIQLATVGKVPPWLGVWSANLILVLTGFFLLIKVEQRFALSHWSSKLWNPKGKVLPKFPKLRQRFNNYLSKNKNSVTPYAGRMFRIIFPKILDLHILRGFFTYFFWSLVACVSLFSLLTVFELLDDIIRNKIAVYYVIEYLFFLTPQILIFAVPMSVLLAVLITLGIMENNSEITAIKAGGCSLYRIAVPIFMVASGLSVSIYIMHDYILPAANIRQDSLRNFIQNKPPQTYRHNQRKWIFGESARIFNYEYYDSNQRAFVRLNVFDIDFENARVLRHIKADHARIGRENQWLLDNGWIRDYKSAEPGIIVSRAGSVSLSEKPGYFEKELFQPKESSKFTYLELRSYIDYLKKSGHNAMDLQVELNKKISFPLSCLVMALLAVPFSFYIGKKGALFGVGISVAIAIAYWGASGLFDAMGAYGLLTPLLAAWAPNILFGASGLTFFLTIKT